MSHAEPHKGEPLEVEVKFFIEDPDLIRQSILAMGAEPHAKVFEVNHCYDDSASTIYKGGKLLRLRDDGTCSLTYKCKPAVPSAAYKVYKEREVVVSDFATMDAILCELGYHTARIYEKWRETFSVPNAELCIDTLPFGVFLEIEGAGTAIDQIAQKLALPWEHRILRNYLSIFEILRGKENLPFQDVTFENFRRHPSQIRPYLSLCQVGS